MTTYQKEIIDFARNNGNEITKKQAVDLIGGAYYCNASKHVGDVLSRMVKANFLIRIKPGEFKVGSGTKYKPNSPVGKNQIDLF